VCAIAYQSIVFLAVAPGHSSITSAPRLNTRAFSTAVWALAQLPDPTKTLGTPVAKAARSKVVAALGAYAIGSIHRMKAEEIFHLLAGLHLLGFKAPDRLEPKPRVNREGKLVAGGAATSFAGLLESRSTKVGTGCTATCMQYIQRTGCSSECVRTQQTAAHSSVNASCRQGNTAVDTAGNTQAVEFFWLFGPQLLPVTDAVRSSSAFESILKPALAGHSCCGVVW